MGSQCYLRGFADRDDRKVLAVGAVPEVDIEANTWASTNERMRSSTRRTARPPRARLVPRRAARGPSMEVDLVGSSCGESLMRPVGVVPAAPERQLLREGGTSERNERKTPRTLVLERPHHPFD